METVQAKRVIRGVAALAGIPMVGSAGDDRADEVLLRAMLSRLDSRLRKAWEHFSWPELMLVEQRYYHQGLWSAGSYNSGDIVYYAPDDTYYQANTGTSETPSSTATDWDVDERYSPLVPTEQTEGGTAKTKLGRVYAAFIEDPREYRGARPLTVQHFDDAGVYIHDRDAPAAPFIWFRKRVPDVDCEVFAAATTYSSGDLVYDHSGTGECYTVNGSYSAGHTPTANSGSFDLIEIPFRFAEYLKRGVYADFLTDEGEHEKARAQGGLARGELERLVAQIVRQGGQLPKVRVGTHRAPQSYYGWDAGG